MRPVIPVVLTDAKDVIVVLVAAAEVLVNQDVQVAAALAMVVAEAAADLDVLVGVMDALNHALTAMDVLMDAETIVVEDVQVVEAVAEAVVDVVHVQGVLDAEVHAGTVEVHVLQTAVLLVEILAQEIAEMTAREDVLTHVKEDVDLLA